LLNETGALTLDQFVEYSIDECQALERVTTVSAFLTVGFLFADGKTMWLAHHRFLEEPTVRTTLTVATHPSRIAFNTFCQSLSEGDQPLLKTNLPKLRASVLYHSMRSRFSMLCRAHRSWMFPATSDVPPFEKGRT